MSAKQRSHKAGGEVRKPTRVTVKPLSDGNGRRGRKKGRKPESDTPAKRATASAPPSRPTVVTSSWGTARARQTYAAGPRIGTGQPRAQRAWASRPSTGASSGSPRSQSNTIPHQRPHSHTAGATAPSLYGRSQRPTSASAGARSGTGPSGGGAGGDASSGQPLPTRPHTSGGPRRAGRSNGARKLMSPMRVDAPHHGLHAGHGEVTAVHAAPQPEVLPLYDDDVDVDPQREAAPTSRSFTSESSLRGDTAAQNDLFLLMARVESNGSKKQKRRKKARKRSRGAKRTKSRSRSPRPRATSTEAGSVHGAVDGGDSRPNPATTGELGATGKSRTRKGRTRRTKRRSRSRSPAVEERVGVVHAPPATAATSTSPQPAPDSDGDDASKVRSDRASRTSLAASRPGGSPTTFSIAFVDANGSPRSRATLATTTAEQTQGDLKRNDPFVRMRRTGASLMKGCARYQNAIDHVEKSILEVTKQIESTRHLTGGADHTMFLTIAEKRLRSTWVGRLDVLKTRISQERAVCAELKEHINSIRQAKVNIMDDYKRAKEKRAQAIDETKRHKEREKMYAQQRFDIMAEISEKEKKLERQVQTIMTSCLEFDNTTDMAALGRNFLIRQRDQRKAEDEERRKRLETEANSEKAKARTAWQVALDTAALRVQEERVDEYRGYLDRIYEAAGETNVDSLIARYVRREGINFRAFCAMNALCGEVEELLKHVMLKREGIEQFLTQAKGVKPKWMDLAKQREELLTRRLRRLEDKHTALQRQLAKALPHVRSLFHTCGCDPDVLDVDMALVMSIPDALKPTRARPAHPRTSGARSPTKRGRSGRRGDSSSDSGSGSDSSSDSESQARGTAADIARLFDRHKVVVSPVRRSDVAEAASQAALSPTRASHSHHHGSPRHRPRHRRTESNASRTSHTSRTSRQSPTRRRRNSVVDRDTKLSARRRRLSLSSIGDGADAARAAALAAAGGATPARTPGGNVSPRDGSLASTGAGGDQGGDDAASSLRGGRTRSLERDMTAAKRRLLRARGNRVASLQAFLRLVSLQRALATGTTPHANPVSPPRSARRGGEVPPFQRGATKGSLVTTRTRRNKRRGPSSRRTSMASSGLSSPGFGRGRGPAVLPPPPIVVGDGKNLFGAQDVHIDSTNMCRALAAVEARVVELLMAEGELERQWKAKRGRQDAKFIELAAGLHTRLRRNKARAPRLAPDSVPGMNSNSLVVLEDNKTDGDGDLLQLRGDPSHQYKRRFEEDGPASGDDADDGESSCRPVKISELRARKWAVEPNQRQRELEEERRVKQQALRRRVAQLEEKQSRQNAARLLINKMRSFKERRRARLAQLQREEELARAAAEAAAQELAVLRAREREAQRRRVAEAVPHKLGAAALEGRDNDETTAALPVPVPPGVGAGGDVAPQPEADVASLYSESAGPSPLAAASPGAAAQ